MKKILKFLNLFRNSSEMDITYGAMQFSDRQIVSGGLFQRIVQPKLLRKE